jgi:hypothetical protein
MTSFGPVPHSLPSLLKPLGLLATGLVGLLTIVIQLAAKGIRSIQWQKLLFASIILTFFIVIGLIELSH